MINATNATKNSGGLPEATAYQPPEILAPAGDRQSFLAALAAGADAVYLGLKNFSARMQAENFSLKELAQLAELARGKDCRIYVAINTLLKSSDLEAAGRLIDRLERSIGPAGLIVQDIGAIELARQAGFSGEIHLSTLANVSHQAAARFAREQLGVDRVVLPRELTLDEIKAVAETCPPGLSLEVFVHGALCYGVSGRCYWSSFLGGKSGLRGRCVQPCRRLYRDDRGGRAGRFFSCKDLGLDILTRTLLAVPQIRALKIEGRKKGPHYVYYTVSAYRALRDNPADAQARKTALELLDQALGRPTTHYLFLPQRKHQPVEPAGQTGSGRLAGSTQHGHKGGAAIKPRFPLLAGDLLRVGYEDEPWHQIVRVRRDLPKAGRLDFKAERAVPRAGTPVFLIDRREPELVRRIQAVETELQAIPEQAVAEIDASSFVPSLPARAARPGQRKGQPRAEFLELRRHAPRGKVKGELGVWLDERALDLPRPVAARIWWSLPPVIWPDEEDSLGRLVSEVVARGARKFILNAPWQAAFFGEERDLSLWAGPFCNLANPLALERLRRLGFAGAVASPELPKEDLLALPATSPLPLGLVVSGTWPLSIARTLADELGTEEPLASPRGEICWARQYGENYWIFPGWEMDITSESREFEKAGYSLFIHLSEPWPRSVPHRDRPGRFNLDLKLL